MKRFEYHVLKGKVSKGAWIFNFGGNVDESELKDEFNNLGRQGWELVTASEPSMAGGQSRNIIFIFKRELAS
ncbi:MAG TPA: DUF4177 domain-containing protein [Verrucomicrobiales bacterium]|jgi:hypothetical protein|nr:DUF4177 domain-containing protein [Verrucomicrobiales bacterium]